MVFDARLVALFMAFLATFFAMLLFDLSWRTALRFRGVVGRTVSFVAMPSSRSHARLRSRCAVVAHEHPMIAMHDDHGNHVHVDARPTPFIRVRAVPNAVAKHPVVVVD